MRIERNTLWAENRHAWELWTQLHNHFVIDHHLGQWLIQSYADGVTGDEALLLVRRLALITETLRPPDNGQAKTRNRS